jgi:aspartate-semialdehyde dehydrogenase
VVEISALAASERSAGKTYQKSIAGRWKLETPIPEDVAKLDVQECKPGLDCRVVFSALDSNVAGPVEESLPVQGTW